MTIKALAPSPLIVAVRSGSQHAVAAALQDGADVNEPDIHGFPGLPLRTACFEGNLAIVRELLLRGANPNAEASDGAGAALRLALRRKHDDVVTLLLQHGAIVPEGGAAVSSEAPTTPSAPQTVELAAPELAAPELPETLAHDNLIEFTPSGLDFRKGPLCLPDEDDSFGTKTDAMSTDLLFLDEDEVPPLDWETPAKR